MKIGLLFIILILTSVSGVSQPKLKVEPEEIEFKSVFQRFQKVLFINKGDAPLHIDSLSYNKPDLYYIRFDKYQRYPLIINPGDTLNMDCILSGYELVSQADTVDTMFVYNNGVKPIVKVKIKIDFYDDDGTGNISGIVSYNNTPVPQANVYFYKEGNYQAAKTIANNNGYYNVQLPPGKYLAAAVKDSFITIFYGGSMDPFNGNYITVNKDSTSYADIELLKSSPISKKISGVVTDKISTDRLRRGIVVIRKGTHTPNKVSIDTISLRAYTSIIKDDGTYEIIGIENPGYYFVQAFSDFYIPGYYNQSGSSVFWQNADSIYISSSVTNINFTLSRDSSFGAGSISGQINSGNRLFNEAAVVYAKSTDYNIPFNYTLRRNGNYYELHNLPYGNYQLVGQQIGMNDVLSDILHITPSSTSFTGVNLNFATDINENQGTSPKYFILNQNFPNPFNPSTTISFSLSERQFVTLKVFNLLGDIISTVISSEVDAGFYKVNFSMGSNLSSGLYIYQLKAGYNSSEKKMLYIK